MSTRAESRVVTWLLAGALRRAGRRLGPAYAEELATTLRRRLLEAGRLSWWRRIGRYAREARALRRLHRGIPYHLGGGSRPERRAPARARGVPAHEFRLALRQLRRAPGFTLGTTLILGRGIGASTAMFTLVDAGTGFEAIAGYTTNGSSWYRQTFTMTLTDEAEPRAVEGTWVSADYFEVLGVALAVPLLVGALVLMLSLGMLERVDPGFEPTGVLSMRISLPVERFESVPALFPAYNALIEQVGAVGGVESAALGSSLPPSRLAVRNNFVIRGRDDQAGGEEVTHYVSVGPEFFATLGIPLLRGRNIAAADNADAPFVAIVDSAFEARYLNAASALGTELQFGGCRECPWARVVGVVGPVHYTGPGSPAEPTIYVPIAQEPQTNFYLVVRADPRAGALIPALRRAVGVAVPGVAPTQVHTMGALLSDAVAAPRYRSLLLGWFALVAIVLAAVGMYAVMASFVSQQRRGIGVRMALGASRVSVVGFVLGRAAVLLGFGVALGIGLSLVAGRMLRQLAQGIDPTSAWLAAAAALVVALVALVSTLVPALRASRLDPVTVLRIE